MALKRKYIIKVGNVELVYNKLPSDKQITKDLKEAARVNKLTKVKNKPTKIEGFTKGNLVNKQI